MSMSQEISGRELERCPLLETSRELYTRDRDTIYPEEAYDLSDADFVAIRDILHRIAGIYLTDSKRDLVSLRLALRLRDRGGIFLDRKCVNLNSSQVATSCIAFFC